MKARIKSDRPQKVYTACGGLMFNKVDFVSIPLNEEEAALNDDTLELVDDPSPEGEIPEDGNEPPAQNNAAQVRPEKPAKPANPAKKPSAKGKKK